MSHGCQSLAGRRTLINISFKTQELHDDCFNLQRAEEQFGNIGAAELVTFLSDAEAFENAGELIAFRHEEIRINVDESLSIAIGTEFRATMVAVGRRFKRDASGQVVWASVTRLKLTEISRLP